MFFFSGRMQVISNKKKGLHRNSKGFSCQNQKFRGVFWPKLGDLQKNRSSPTLGELLNQKTPLFWSKQRQVLYNFDSQILWGGAVFIFGAKISLKSTRNVLFCIFFRPMGEARAPPPWLRYRSIVDNCYILTYSIYIFCLFVNSEQTHYFKIGKFCLFMMSRPKLNVKWQVTQTGGQSGLQLSSF